MLQIMVAYLISLLFSMAPEPTNITDLTMLPVTDQMVACLDAGSTVVILIDSDEKYVGCAPTAGVTPVGK